VGSDVILGLIPGGTGNLLAGNLRIPPSPARAAKVLVTGVPKRIDLGRLDRDTGQDYFAVACGAGYDAVIKTRTMSEHKRRWGMLAYVATTLRFIGEIRARAPHRGGRRVVRRARLDGGGGELRRDLPAADQAAVGHRLRRWPARRAGGAGERPG
jgi:hypothetical protein